jgi:hypothetical protein
MKAHKGQKTFDCIEFKRRVQAEIYEDIKGLSPEEEIAYFQREVATGPLGTFWKSLERRRESVDGVGS